MDLPSLTFAASVTGVALGTLGLGVVIWRMPSRFSPVAVLLIAGFAVLGLGGLAGLQGVEDLVLHAQLGLAAGAALCVLSGICVIFRVGGIETRARLAESAAESARREMQRLGGTNVRLEDELAEIKGKMAKVGQSEQGRATANAAAIRRQVKVMDRIQSSERKHKSVFEHAIEGMAMLERETLRLELVNGSLARMTGYEVGDLNQRTIVDLFADGETKPGKLDLQRAAREGRPLPVTLCAADGQLVPTEVSVCVVGEGDDAQLLTVVRDVTHRRTLERELSQHVEALQERERRLQEVNRQLGERTNRIEQMNVRLQQLQEAKDHFLSSVSHELRTPLTSIRSFSEILLKHGTTDPKISREFLEIINKESERLTRMVNDVLDLSRIEAGEMHLALSEFDARDVLNDAAASTSGMAAERSVRIERNLGVEPWPLFADRDRVQQLAMNLIANAIKFSPESSSIEIEIRAGAEAGHVQIGVRDRGPGIAAEDRAAIFEKFRQAADTLSDRRGGSGLGLTISREIAAVHGAQIWVDSQVGKGSTFWVAFPGAAEARELFQAAASESAERPRVPIVSQRPIPVLRLEGVVAGSDDSDGLGSGGLGSGRDQLPTIDEMSKTGTLPPLFGM